MLRTGHYAIGELTFKQSTERMNYPSRIDRLTHDTCPRDTHYSIWVNQGGTAINLRPCTFSTAMEVFLLFTNEKVGGQWGMGMKIYVNGKYVSKEQATVSVFDHGFLYGDGIFEGIRSYGGNVFRLKEHVERLYDSAKSIMLQIPMSPEQMEEAICETIRQNQLQDSYIRVVISRGVGDLGICPTKCETPNVIIIAASVNLFPPELYEKGLRTATVSVRRNRPDALNPKIKSLNYLNNIMVKIEANLAGVSEAIILNDQGYVTEGSADNIFVVKKGQLFTPPSYLGALEGITRQAIIDIANKLGIVVREEPFTLHDVYIADEVFLTGTAAEVIPVIDVDGRTIGTGKPGAMTNRLLEEFRKIVYIEGTKL